MKILFFGNDRDGITTAIGGEAFVNDFDENELSAECIRLAISFGDTDDAGNPVIGYHTVDKAVRNFQKRKAASK